MIAHQPPIPPVDPACLEALRSSPMAALDALLGRPPAPCDDEADPTAPPPKAQRVFPSL
jgi:hypothetical protein